MEVLNYYVKESSEKVSIIVSFNPYIVSIRNLMR
jgi:hypothetical protein